MIVLSQGGVALCLDVGEGGSSTYLSSTLWRWRGDKEDV